MPFDFKNLAPKAASQHGLLSRRQLLECGLTKRQIHDMLSRGQLERMSNRVLRLGGAPPSWEQDLAAACLFGEPPAIASHRSALRLWGLRTVDDEIEVSVRYPRRMACPTGIVHRMVDLVGADVTWIDGVPVTSPVRSLCDAGLIFPDDEVRRMVDHAVAVELVTSQDLWRFRRRVGRQGRNGCGVLERVLESMPESAEVAESGPEVLLARICERYGLPAPAVQFVVRVEGRDFRVDLGFPDERVFCEFDGVEYHTGMSQIAADGGRQNALVAAGWTPLRFIYRDLTERPSQVARLLHRTLNRAPDRAA